VAILNPAIVKKSVKGIKPYTTDENDSDEILTQGK
jgi:hypothetical protein